MNSTVTEPTAAERVAAAIAKHGLSVRAEFVPFSQSRNKAEKSPSLNWRVTLVKTYGPEFSPSGKESKAFDILTTDYSAGCGHCPAYKNPPTFADGRVDSYRKDKGIKAECETGRAATHIPENGEAFTYKGKPILPDTANVLYSLVMDASVLDSRGFEDWAADFGYDTDSRKAEAIYRACLDIALKLRNGLGEAVLAELQEAFQDY